MPDMQDCITEAIVDLLEPQIRKAEIERVRHKRPERARSETENARSAKT